MFQKVFACDARIHTSGCTISVARPANASKRTPKSRPHQRDLLSFSGIGCHSRRESAFRFRPSLFVIPEGNCVSSLHSLFLLSFPKGICVSHRPAPSYIDMGKCFNPGPDRESTLHPPRCGGIAPRNDTPRIYRSLRRTSASNPSIPVPISSSDSGSGTGLDVNEPASPGSPSALGPEFGLSIKPVAFARPAA